MLTASAVQVTANSGDKTLGVLVVIGLLIWLFHGSQDNMPASDQDVEVWACEACAEICRRWSQASAPVDLSDYFDRQEYRGRAGEFERVTTSMREVFGAVEHLQPDGRNFYSASVALQHANMEELLRGIRDRPVAGLVTVHSGAFAQIGDYNSASGISIDYSRAQGESLDAIVRALRELALSSELGWEPSGNARSLAQDIEVAKKDEPAKIPGLLARAGTFTSSLGSVADVVVRVIAAAHALGL